MATRNTAPRWADQAGKAPYVRDKKAGYVTFLLILSIFQLFVPGLGTQLSIYMVFVASFAVWQMTRIKPTEYPYSIILLLIIVKIFYVFTSISPVDGVRDIWTFLPFVGLFLYAWRSNNNESVQDALKIAVIFGTFQSSIVIVFRLFPAIEAAFWHSIAASLTIGAGAMDAFNGGAANNTYDPDKAGGFMLNANPAGAWSMIMLFSAAALRRRFRSKRAFYSVCAIHLFSALLCGSKATIMIVLGTPTFMLVIYCIRQLSSPTGLVIPKSVLLVTPTFIMAAVLLIVFPPNLSSSFSDNSAHTLASRTIMWGFAWQYFLQHPFYGLGYGGWAYQRMMDVPAQAALVQVELLFPPHNSLVYLWTYNGLAGVILTLWFFISAIVSGLRRSNLPVFERSALICAIIAPLLQAQGENFSLFGEYHMAGMLGMCVGMLINRTHKHPDITQSPDAQPSYPNQRAFHQV